MAEIIRFPFGNKKPAEKPAEENRQAHVTDLADEDDDPVADLSQFTPEQLRAMTVDLLYIGQNKDHVSAMRDKLEQITDHIFSLRDFAPNKANIRLRREGLNAHTLQEICELVDTANNPLQWQTDPSYYGALMLEYDRRVKRAISLLPKD